MKIINSSVEILTPIDRESILKLLEVAGRVCYRSENLISDNSKEKFIKNIVKSGHLSVIEHVNITVKFITNRGVTHEMVRHRLASYSQESSRYCNYSKDKFNGEIQYIDVNEGFENLSEAIQNEIIQANIDAETHYNNLIKLGAKPDLARNVLNNATKTIIVMTTNLREWMHFFNVRDDKKAHPEIRMIANKLHNECRDKLPEIFE